MDALVSLDSLFSHTKSSSVNAICVCDFDFWSANFLKTVNSLIVSLSLKREAQLWYLLQYVTGIEQLICNWHLFFSDWRWFLVVLNWVSRSLIFSSHVPSLTELQKSFWMFFDRPVGSKFVGLLQSGRPIAIHLMFLWDFLEQIKQLLHLCSDAVFWCVFRLLAELRQIFQCPGFFFVGNVKSKELQLQKNCSYNSFREANENERWSMSQRAEDRARKPISSEKLMRTCVDPCFSEQKIEHGSHARKPWIEKWILMGWIHGLSNNLIWFGLKLYNGLV